MKKRFDQGKVLIADNSVFMGLIMNNYLNKQKHLRVVGAARNAREIEAIMDIEMPDIVIMNLNILEDQKKKYFEQSARLEKVSKVLLYDTQDECWKHFAETMGARCCIPFPLDMESVYAKTLEILHEQGKLDALSTVKNVQARKIDGMVRSIFLTIGIPEHLKGYQYLIEAIRMVVISPDIINNIMRVLYPGIAENFHTNAIRVERSIRNAIEFAWRGGKMENLNHIFGYDVLSGKKPTNGEFIALIAAKFDMETKRHCS